MKRTIQALIFALIFILSCSFTTFASEVYTEGYFKYTVEDDSVSIYEYYGKESEVTVPSMIVGNPVSTIAKGAFSDNSNVKKVNLPDTIMTIEEGAFAPGISIVYDSNTDEPIESGTTDKPSDPDDPDTSSGNTENTDNTTDKANDVGIEEIEVNLADDTISGISLPNTEKTLTVNDKKQLVSIDADGTETVLDDTQTYTLTENEDGSVKITNADGKEVSIDEDGNPIIPSASNEESVSKINAKTVATVVIVVVIIVIVVIALCFRKRKKVR